MLAAFSNGTEAGEKRGGVVEGSDGARRSRDCGAKVDVCGWRVRRTSVVLGAATEGDGFER